MSFCLYNKKNMAKTIFYERAQRVSKILFCHSKIKFMSSRHRVISSIYLLRLDNDNTSQVITKYAHLMFKKRKQTLSQKSN